MVKGIGGYTSTRKINFKIVPKQVKNLRQVSKTSSSIKISWDKDKMEKFNLPKGRWFYTSSFLDLAII